MLIAFVVNAFDQPYRRGSDVLSRLKRDGILIYSVRIGPPRSRYVYLTLHDLLQALAGGHLLR